MPLDPGTRIGPYEITALIGVGGMGEVYRARDTKLDRDVALKILPDLFASDPDRLARFEREAKALATLNHPHIAHVHGLEDGGQTRALVMELVDGEELAQRIAHGAIPIDEALRLARQIAEALEAAHAQGIIHRDLKPANVKVNAAGQVKVLDFGLAKALDRESGLGTLGPSGANRGAVSAPTLTSPAGMTRVGIILGTAAYMSPEQARGRAVDQRADIWAFGCVLYEMLTARRPFAGDDITDVLARVIEREPDWDALPPGTPPIVRSLLKRCLRKDPSQRLHHIADARLDLDEAIAAPNERVPVAQTLPSRRGPGVLALVSVGLAGVVLGAAGLWFALAPQVSESLRPIQFDIPVTNGAVSRFTLSPDGRYLAYLAQGAEGAIDVLLRDLGLPTANRVAESDVRTWLVWSADGADLLIGTGAGERRVNVSTGSSLVQPWTGVDAPGPLTGGGLRMALPDGRYLGGADSAGRGPLRVISAKGSEPALDLDAAVGEVGQLYPVLADRKERSFTYASFRSNGSRFVCVATLGSLTRKCAGPFDYNSAAVYRDGTLLYARGRSLLARPFDLVGGAFTGDEQVLADRLLLQRVGSGLALFTASETGVVAFPVGAQGDRLVWVDSAGRETAISDFGATTDLALARDDRRVLSRAGNGLVLLDLQRGGTISLGESGGDVVWAPDGQRLTHRTKAGIVIRTVEDPRETVVLEGTTIAFPEDWSPDGKWIVAGVNAGPFQVVLVPVLGGEPRRFLSRTEAPFYVDEMHFSPDGRWLAFNGISGGRDEVFVVPIPPTGERVQVSTRGGVQARWHPSGKTLHYVEPNGTMMSVDIAPGVAFSAGKPRGLFDLGFAPSRGFDDYVIATDGRFLVKKPAAGGSEAIRVIVNWRALLK